MSDPFSVAANAVGVISLGLQVCQALVSYYQAWHGQDEEVDNFLQQCNAVTKTLSLLQNKLESPLRVSSEIVNQIENLSEQLTTAVRRLESVLEECRKTTDPKPLKRKLQDATRRTLYPFRRSTILNLQETVKNMQLSLITALQLLQVDLCASLPSIDRAVSHLREATGSVHEKAVAADKNITIIQNGVGTIIHEFPGLYERIDQVLSHLEELKLNSKSEKAVQPCRTSQGTSIRDFQLALLDKPSVFRSVCDDVGLSSAYPRSTRLNRLSRQCSCKSHTQRHSTFLSSKSLSVSKSTIYTTCHRPECVYWHPFQQSHSMRLTASYMSSILMMTLRATINISTGAGGCSISPSLSYHRIVPNTAPAFSLLTEEKLQGACQNPSEYLATVSNSLIRLFRKGEALPQDVNEEGENILHRALRGMDLWNLERRTVEALTSFVFDLLAVNVPVNETTCAGLTVLDMIIEDGIMGFEVPSESLVHLGAQLVEEGAEAGQNLFSDDRKIWSYSGTSATSMLGFELQYATQFDTWIEAAGCGPLSTAILRKNQQEVARLLIKSTSYLKEVTSRGQTPIHLASNWPPGLKILLAAGGNELVNNSDRHRNLPIGYACELECIDSVRMLLESGSALSARSAWTEHEQILVYATRRGNGNKALRAILIDALCRQRGGLYELALVTLPQDELDALALPPDRLPDHQAPKLQATLWNNRVKIPRSLVVTQFAGSVFHVIFDVETAKLLFDLGFRDVNCPDTSGLTPIMRQCFRSDLKLKEGLQYFDWLLSHGCDLHRTVERDGEFFYLPNVEAERFIGIFIGQKFMEQSMFEVGCYCLEPRLKHLIHSVFTSASTDSCVCACTSNGCSPIITMLRSIEAYPYHIVGESWVERVKEVRLWSLGWLEKTIEASDNHYERLLNSADIIRFQTFEELGVRHTCCPVKLWGIKNGGLDDDEIRDIQSEDRFLINRLEELVLEFTQQYKQLEQPLTEFLKGPWASRMEEILKDQSLSDEELANIRDLGVVLRPDEEGIGTILGSNRYLCVLCK